MATETAVPVKSDQSQSTPPAPTAPSATLSPLESLRREIERTFDNFQIGSWRLPFARSGLEFGSLLGRGGAWSLSPAVDVTESADGYSITAELPGMDEKDIEVKLSNGALTIKGEKKEETERREEDRYVSERRYGSFLRSFPVPEDVDRAKVEASFCKGVLTVKLPKSPEAQQSAQTIAVKAA